MSVGGWKIINKLRYLLHNKGSQFSCRYNTNMTEVTRDGIIIHAFLLKVLFSLGEV